MRNKDIAKTIKVNVLKEAIKEKKMRTLSFTLIGIGLSCALGLLIYAFSLGVYSPIVLFGVAFNMWAVWKGFRGI